LLGGEIFQTKVVFKSQIFPFMFSKLFFPENLSIHEIMRKTFLEPGRPQTTIWRKRIACWIPKATDIHSEYVILKTIYYPTDAQIYNS